MKVLIWVLCIFVNAIITTIIKGNGVILGAIPTVILYSVTIGLAPILCKMWDKRKSAKATIQTVKTDTSPVPNKCEMCGRICDKTTPSTIRDDMGVRYRNLCDACMKIYNATPNAVSRPPHNSDSNKTPKMYGNYSAYDINVAKNSDKIICPMCKNELLQDSAFCQYCGSKVETPTEIAPVQDEVVVPEESHIAGANATVAEILASGLIKGQKAMEANKESQPHNELDADFGLVPHKPVYTVGIDEQQKYLKSLSTINGVPIKWNRRGAMIVDGINGVVDVYDTFLPSGEEYKTIYINMYGAYNSTFVPKGFSYSTLAPLGSERGMKLKNKKQKSKIKISHLIIGIVILLGIIAGGLAIGFSVHYNGLYGKLCDEMLEIDYDNYYYYSDSIAMLIDRLPSNYRDMKDIESQYKQIDKHVEIIKSAAWLNEKASIQARGAYAALYQFNLQNDNWDLSEYLEGVLEKSFGKFVFGMEWENSDYYFQWCEDGDGDGERLSTNLPNRMDDNENYYFYNDYSDGSSSLNPRLFGFENTNNSSDCFLAYRIMDISYTGSQWQIRIFCYSDARIYTLS